MRNKTKFSLFCIVLSLIFYQGCNLNAPSNEAKQAMNKVIQWQVKNKHFIIWGNEGRFVGEVKNIKKKQMVREKVSETDRLDGLTEKWSQTCSVIYYDLVMKKWAETERKAIIKKLNGVYVIDYGVPIPIDDL